MGTLILTSLLEDLVNTKATESPHNWHTQSMTAEPRLTQSDKQQEAGSGHGLQSSLTRSPSSALLSPFSGRVPLLKYFTSLLEDLVEASSDFKRRVGFPSGCHLPEAKR